MNSILYKLVVNNVIVNEGNKKAMKKLSKSTPNSFVGLGSPLSCLGRNWK
jgi:hypothetical protein